MPLPGGIKDHNAAPPGHAGWVRNLRGAEHQTGANWKSATENDSKQDPDQSSARPDALGGGCGGKLLGRALSAVNTDEGVRTVMKSKPIEPERVERCLESKFEGALPEARKAMTEVANAFDPDDLAQQGFSLCEQFRVQILEGVSDWGAKGELDLGRIGKLALQTR